MVDRVLRDSFDVCLGLHPSSSSTPWTIIHAPPSASGRSTHKLSSYLRVTPMDLPKRGCINEIYKLVQRWSREMLKRTAMHRRMRLIVSQRTKTADCE